MLQIYGVPFSAHTRKVLLGLREKGLSSELLPLVPLAPELPEAFLSASPLRKIPVLVHDGLSVTDSSVIALYLDRVFPDRPVYPTAPAAYAKALFVEELVDGALAPHVLHGLLLQRVFAPRFMNQAPDETLIQRSLTEHIPARLNDLERLLDAEWFAGDFSYADITVLSILLNFAYAGERVDAVSFPKLAAFFERALQRKQVIDALRAELPAARDVPGLDLGVLEAVVR